MTGYENGFWGSNRRKGDVVCGSNAMAVHQNGDRTRCTGKQSILINTFEAELARRQSRGTQYVVRMRGGGEKIHET